MKTLKINLGLIFLLSLLFSFYSNAQNEFGTSAGNVGGSGTNNTANGFDAFHSFTTGNDNSAFGYAAMFSLTAGGGNVAVGDSSLYSVIGSTTKGSINTALGTSSLKNHTVGLKNVAVGYRSLYNDTAGKGNTAVGTNALEFLMDSLPDDSNNTAIGNGAGMNTTAGTDNVFVGANAGSGNTTGINNTFVGSSAGTGVGGTINNYTALGYNAGDGTGTTNGIDLGNTSNTKIRSKNTTITAYSDARIKDNIAENVPGLSFITQLRPVTYYYNIHRENEILTGKKDNTDWPGKYDVEKIRQSGFIAQEVEKSAAKVDYDFNGLTKPTSNRDLYGISYAMFVVPLVKAVQEQQTMIETLQQTAAQQQQTLTQQQDALATVLNQLQEIKDCCSSGSSSGSPSQLSTPQLFNAVPNPTSGSSLVYYFVPQTAKMAKIQLTDATGVVLQTINATNLGYSSIALQTGGLAGGMYQYSLIVDDHLVDTKKLNVVLK
jgi:hypothetical protein